MLINCRFVVQCSPYVLDTMSTTMKFSSFLVVKSHKNPYQILAISKIENQSLKKSHRLFSIFESWHFFQKRQYEIFQKNVSCRKSKKYNTIQYMKNTNTNLENTIQYIVFFFRIHVLLYSHNTRNTSWIHCIVANPDNYCRFNTNLHKLQNASKYSDQIFN